MAGLLWTRERSHQGTEGGSGDGKGNHAPTPRTGYHAVPEDRWEPMPKPNFQYEKRQREIEKKKKRALRLKEKRGEPVVPPEPEKTDRPGGD